MSDYESMEKFQRDLDPLESKAQDLRKLHDIVVERFEFEQAEKLVKGTKKMGARLQQIGELEEWILNQQKTKNQPAGSNVFIYKNQGKQESNEQQYTDDVELVERLKNLHL